MGYSQVAIVWAAMSSPAGFVSRLPLYIGGFMGPFGTIVIIPMFPELRTEFEATSGQVSLAFSLYLFPFALLLLVSGTLGERWGRRRTIRGAYLVYAAASVVAVVAPSLTIFVATRVIMGCANAFLTPLLIAGLAELVPPERLGREIGIYSSFQALGGGLGPVLGGIAADTTWQLAFVGTGLVSLGLTMFPPAGEPKSEAASAPRIRPLLTRKMILLGLAFGFAAAGPVGLSMLIGVAARDVLEMSGTAAGLVMLAGAASVTVMSPTWGNLVDRSGPRLVGLASIALATLTVGLPILIEDPIMFGAVWAPISALLALIVVVFQALGATLMPENRGGALSFLMSFRFLGHALGPLMFVPLIESSPRVAFFGAAALGVVTLALVAIALPSTDSH